MQEKRGNRGVEMSGQRIKKIDTSEKDFEVYTQVKDAVCMIDIEKNELIYMNEEAKNISRKFLADGNYVAKVLMKFCNWTKNSNVLFARISCFPRRVSY